MELLLGGLDRANVLTPQANKANGVLLPIKDLDLVTTQSIYAVFSAAGQTVHSII